MVTAERGRAITIGSITVQGKAKRAGLLKIAWLIPKEAEPLAKTKVSRNKLVIEPTIMLAKAPALVALGQYRAAT